MSSRFIASVAKVSRIVRIALVAATAVGGGHAAIAQTTTDQTPAEGQASLKHDGRWEFIVPTGQLIPTGAERDAIDRGNLTAAQLSYVVRPQLAITGMFGWARTYDVGLAGAPQKVDLFTYDLGAEVRAPRWIGSKAISFRPFAGGGAGGRSYAYRDLDVDATHDLGAYASAGAELGIHRIRVRLEVRDYMTGSGLRSGGGTANANNNDVVMMVGLGFKR